MKGKVKPAESLQKSHVVATALPDEPSLRVHDYETPEIRPVTGRSLRIHSNNYLSLTIIFLQFPYCYSRVPSGEVDPAAADKDCVGEDPDVDQDGDSDEVLLPLHLPLVTQDPQGETGQHWQR